jgi:disulfide bond formation protein DsbB
MRPAPAAMVIALASAAAILGAYFFQYVIGLAPCPLCLDQRIPHYIAIPLALVVALAAARGAPQLWWRAGFALLAIVLVVAAGLGVYHAGIEWKLWAGPTECSGALPALGGALDLAKQMQAATLVRCDEAAWRLFGLSLAGYNVIVSLVLAAVSVAGLTAKQP